MSERIKTTDQTAEMPRVREAAKLEVGIGYAALVMVVSPVAGIHMIENRSTELALAPENEIKNLSHYTEDDLVKFA